MLDLPNIKIIGLTGMSGAGKSTVREVFAASGFFIIDCDSLARKIADDRDFLDELQSRFPERLLNDDNTLNRAVTAKIIFTDGIKRKLYNQIIFPYIIYSVIRSARRSNGDIVLDAPTLFESGLDMICTELVGVIADIGLCADRITRRDNITREQAYERLSAQRGADFFKARCGYIIENNGALSELETHAEKIAEQLKGAL